MIKALTESEVLDLMAAAANEAMTECESLGKSMQPTAAYGMGVLASCFFRRLRQALEPPATLPENEAPAGPQKLK